MKTLGCNLVQAVVCNNKNRPGQHSPSASRQQSSWRRVSPLTCGAAQVFSDYQTLWLWSWRQEPSWLQHRPAPLERPLRPPDNKYHQHLIQERGCQNIVPAHHLVRAGVSVPSVVGGHHILSLFVVLEERVPQKKENPRQYGTRLVSLSSSSPPSSSLAGGMSGFKVMLTRSPCC